MKKLGKQLVAVLDAAASLVKASDADGILFLVESVMDWRSLSDHFTDGETLIVSSDEMQHLEGATEAGLKTLFLDMEHAPVYELLTQAMLEAVADEFLSPGASVVAIYSGFEAGHIDSVSLIRLREHLGRLTARDLQTLETQVPLDTLKAVVDLAVDIGREGREAKPVGCIIVVGDHRKVLEQSRPVGFDPVKGYSRKERNLSDGRVREDIKEIVQMDGALIVAADGTVEASRRYIQTPPVDLTMTTGLGARHWAAAAISKNTNAISAVVSESSGTVRIFQNGEVVLRIEPLRRAMKWREFDFEPPPSSDT